MKKEVKEKALTFTYKTKTQFQQEVDVSKYQLVQY